MVVTWSTWNATDSIAHFGVNPSSMTSEAKGSSFIFEDGGSAKRKQYIHTATMTPLQPNTQYCKASFSEPSIFSVWSFFITYSTETIPICCGDRTQDSTDDKYVLGGRFYLDRMAIQSPSCQL